MYSRCDYLMFVYFLTFPSLLHSSIAFILVSVLYLHLAMPSYMVCSQLLIKWKMGGAQNSGSFATPLINEQDDKESCFRRPK